VRFNAEISGRTLRGFIYQTRRESATIIPQGVRWSIIYQNENLGSYHSPEAAADDASGGHTFSPSNGVDLGQPGISADIGDWRRI
jgi:hypothetical protein